MRKTILIATIALFIGFGTTSCVTPRPPHGPHPEHPGPKPPKPPKEKKPKHPKPPKKEKPPHDYWYGQTAEG